MTAHGLPPLIRLRHLLPPQKARGEKALDWRELQEKARDADEDYGAAISQFSSGLVATMMVRRQISFDAHLYAQAKASAERRGISFAELCRRAVAEVIARESLDHPWMSFAGVLDGGARDSESVNSVVYDREAP